MIHKINLDAELEVGSTRNLRTREGERIINRISFHIGRIRSVDLSHNSENQSNVLEPQHLEENEPCEELPVKIDQSSQTEIPAEGSLLLKYETVKKELIKAQKELSFLREKVRVQENYKNLFNQSQQRMIESQKNIHWKQEDIADAISLYSHGPRCYKYLKDKMQMPLPTIRTLQNWVSKVDCHMGLQDFVFPILQAKVQDEDSKLVILSFDEMKIKCEICYDVSGDCVLGPHSYVQVIMARSLLGNWKQPVYYNFDQKMTKEILFSVVKKFDEFGFKVIAITNDMGGGNRGLWRDLGISALNPNFRVDDMGEEIFVFPDAPHLLKLIRNHFLDKGLMYKGVLVNQNPIREMIQQTSQNELRIAYKVSEEHLTVKAAARQKVKYAAQLFSRSVYAALIHLGSAGKLRSPNWRETAEFIKLVNDWFDLLNSSVPYRDSRERVHAYCASPVQNQILTEMKSVAINLLRRKTKLPFQNGIIMFSNALPLLYQSVRKTHNVQYILTSRLSQDVLEHFFSVVRSIGGLHDHPHALEFKYRFRRLLISSNTESMSRERNVLPDKGCSSNFITSYANSPEVIVSQETLADFAEPENTEHPEQDHEDNADPSYVEDNVLCLQEIQECGLEYIAGYVAFKRRGTEVLGYPTSQHAGVNSRWIQLLSEGGLYCPTDDFLVLVYVMERIFEKHNPTDGISKSANILQTLISESTSLPCSEQTRKLFFRTRIYIRIKYLNSKIKASQTQVQGKKNKKKMVKIIT